MRTLIALALLTPTATALFADHHAKKANQYYELRQYQLKDAKSAAKVDAYLAGALKPALQRLGAGPVGIFKEITPGEQPVRFVLITHKSIEQFAKSKHALAGDKAYQQAAADYLDTPRKDAPLKRIRSELLYAFDCQPQLKVPELSKQNKDRIFELRVYESATEKLGDLKVEMFNAGEVPIFLDCGILPVFLGQSLVGDLMPNLTYMTVYPNKEAQAEGWQKFRVHPDWKKLSALAKYKGTVSKIHKFELAPVEGSDL